MRDACCHFGHEVVKDSKEIPICVRAPKDPKEGDGPNGIEKKICECHDEGGEKVCACPLRV